MKSKASLTDLFITFAKIGAMTFGGGYAMIPFIQAEVVDKKSWLTEKQLLDFFAISQATPGVLAVNVASLVGYRYRGILGSVVATAGVVFPSMVLVCIIAAFFNKFIENPMVAQVFASLRICVCVLIIKALSPFFKNGITDKFTAAVFIASALAFAFINISPVWIIIAAASTSVFYAKMKGDKK